MTRSGGQRPNEPCFRARRAKTGPRRHVEKLVAESIAGRSGAIVRKPRTQVSTISEEFSYFFDMDGRVRSLARGFAAGRLGSCGQQGHFRRLPRRYGSPKEVHRETFAFRARAECVGTPGRVAASCRETFLEHRGLETGAAQRADRLPVGRAISDPKRCLSTERQAALEGGCTRIVCELEGRPQRSPLRYRAAARVAMRAYVGNRRRRGGRAARHSARKNAQPSRSRFSRALKARDGGGRGCPVPAACDTHALSARRAPTSKALGRRRRDESSNNLITLLRLFHHRLVPRKAAYGVQAHGRRTQSSSTKPDG
jgi:hypothetical protein